MKQRTQTASLCLVPQLAGSAPEHVREALRTGCVAREAATRTLVVENEAELPLHCTGRVLAQLAVHVVESKRLVYADGTHAVQGGTEVAPGHRKRVRAAAGRPTAHVNACVYS